LRCEPVLSSAYIYPVVAWFVFTFILSAFSLLYAAVEAKKKHTELEEAYQSGDGSYSEEYYSDEEGSDMSSMYETMPEEYRVKSSTHKRSHGSLVNNLDQIIEDEDEDAESEEEKESCTVINRTDNSEQSSDDSEVEVGTSRFTKYRGSLSGKGKPGKSSSDESEVDADTSRFSNYHGSLTENASNGSNSPEEDSRQSSITSQPSSTSVTSKESRTPSTASMQSSISNRNTEFSKDKLISEHRHPRNTLKVPNARSRASLARTESQNRADFLLKMMSKGGDYRTYRSKSPDIVKKSPTGRKISMDMKPRASSSFGVVNKRPKVVQSDDASKKLDHIYVNLPDMGMEHIKDSDKQLLPVDEENLCDVKVPPSEEIADCATTNM